VRKRGKGREGEGGEIDHAGTLISISKLAWAMSPLNVSKTWWPWTGNRGGGKGGKRKKGKRHAHPSGVIRLFRIDPSGQRRGSGEERVG